MNKEEPMSLKEKVGENTRKTKNLYVDMKIVMNRLTEVSQAMNAINAFIIVAQEKKIITMAELESKLLEMHTAQTERERQKREDGDNAKNN